MLLRERSQSEKATNCTILTTTLQRRKMYRDSGRISGFQGKRGRDKNTEYKVLLRQ